MTRVRKKTSTVLPTTHRAATELYPWHAEEFPRLVGVLDQAHAIPAVWFYGESGWGAAHLAEHWIKALLCWEPSSLGGCGRCVSCQAWSQGRHDDVRVGVHSVEHTISVEWVREVLEWAFLKPASAPRKVVFLNLQQPLHAASAQIWLKSIEEPPAHLCFVWVCPYLSWLPLTLKSRCWTVNTAGNALDFERYLKAHSLPEHSKRYRSWGPLKAQQEQREPHWEALFQLMQALPPTAKEWLQNIHALPEGDRWQALGVFIHERTQHAWSTDRHKEVRDWLACYDEWMEFKRSRVPLNADLWWTKMYFTLRTLLALR